ncbi:RnfH family protein [Oxalobacteraceae bacterium OM1]|nr:RnfH family protein [Oxalobacteraceae bacterium OM1]
MAEAVTVVVCYALPDYVFRRALSVPAGTTLRAAVEGSGLLEACPDIDLETARVGIYGKARPLDTVLRENDRVEVYRPLIADPKEARRRRAFKKAG